MFKKLFSFFPESTKQLIREVIDEYDAQVKFIETIQKLDVKDGDILLVKYPRVLRREAHESLRGAIEKIINDFGFKVHVMVFEDGMSVDVLTKNEQGE